MAVANPVFTDRTFSRAVRAREESMTVQGTVLKSGFLLVLAAVSAAWTWRAISDAGSDFRTVGPWIVTALIAGFVIALVTSFRETWAPVTGPLYALVEGVVIGGFSGLLEKVYPGVVVQAVGLTFAVFLATVFLYSAQIVRVTSRFVRGVAMATMGVLIVYVADLLLHIGGYSVPFLHQSGRIGILVSLVIVVIAAANLLTSIDFIAEGARTGSPKYLEWYGAFGLIVCLVWLYLEALRLLAKLRDY
jgi:uncharacterized YccA/Bax inhibitor family protein